MRVVVNVQKEILYAMIVTLENAIRGIIMIEPLNVMKVTGN